MASAVIVLVIPTITIIDSIFEGDITTPSSQTNSLTIPSTYPNCTMVDLIAEGFYVGCYMSRSINSEATQGVQAAYCPIKVNAIIGTDY